MARLVLNSIFLTFVALSVAAQDKGGTSMMFLRQPLSPAQLIETKHTSKDFLEAAKLMNQGERPLTSYRIGWVAVYRSGNEVGIGLPIEALATIRKSEIATVPAQFVSPDLTKRGATFVLFFVAETRDDSGNIWRADLEKVEAQARKLESLLAD